MNFLVFRLYGPLASWGEAAVGGDRPSACYPSRSAILGLLGAALGIRRGEHQRLEQLRQTVMLGVKQYTCGTLLRDYHTTQVPTQDKKRVLRTRKDELSDALKLNTVLSTRDYRSDGMWVVAIWLKDGTELNLQTLQQHLIKPKFILSLGRKSCPLAAPLVPVIVESSDLKSALDTEFPPLLEARNQDAMWLNIPDTVTYYWQGDSRLLKLSSEDATKVQSHTRWDEPIHRERWQFANRLEHQVVLSQEAN